jgi:hypothetical protein
MISNLVYHFTDSVRLPWILDAGEIRPGTCRHLEGWPDMNYVWAITNPIGSLSAAAVIGTMGTLYRNCLVWKVRFTLSADDFEPFLETIKHVPGWCDDHTTDVYETACGDDPADWRTHYGPIPKAKWLAIHARSYLSDWREIPRDLDVHPAMIEGKPVRMIMFGGRGFSSIRLNENPMSYGFHNVGICGEECPANR